MGYKGWSNFWMRARSNTHVTRGQTSTKWSGTAASSHWSFCSYTARKWQAWEHREESLSWTSLLPWTCLHSQPACGFSRAWQQPFQLCWLQEWCDIHLLGTGLGPTALFVSLHSHHCFFYWTIDLDKIQISCLWVKGSLSHHEFHTPAFPSFQLSCPAPLPPSGSLSFLTIFSCSFCACIQLSDIHNLFFLFPLSDSLCPWATLLLYCFPPVSASLAPVSASTTNQRGPQCLSPRFSFLPLSPRSVLASCPAPSLLSPKEPRFPLSLWLFNWKIHLPRQEQHKIRPKLAVPACSREMENIQKGGWTAVSRV